MNLWWALILETSLFFNGGVVQYDPIDYVLFEEPITAMIQGEVGVGVFSLYGAVSTDMWMQYVDSLTPFNNQYTVGARLVLRNLTIGVEHSCYHPMIPYQWVNSRRQITPAFEGALDRVYVNLTFRHSRYGR